MRSLANRGVSVCLASDRHRDVPAKMGEQPANPRRFDPGTGEVDEAPQVEAAQVGPAWPRSLAGNPNSPQAGVFLTSIIDEIVDIATYDLHHHAI